MRNPNEQDSKQNVLMLALPNRLLSLVVLLGTDGDFGFVQRAMSSLGLI